MSRIRFSYACGKESRYLSHLDLLRLFQRSMRRAGLPLAYTLGFNPRPRLSLAAPLPLGVTASREYGEIYLTAPLSASSFCRRLGIQLPAGLTLTGAITVPANEPPLASVVNAALYRAAWKGKHRPPARDLLQKSLDKVMSQKEIMVRRLTKSGKFTGKNIRPFIFQAELLPPGKISPVLRLLLQVGSKGGVSPFRFLELLPPGGENSSAKGQHQYWSLHRQGLYIYSGVLIDPFPEGGDMVDG